MRKLGGIYLWRTLVIVIIFVIVCFLGWKLEKEPQLQGKPSSTWNDKPIIGILAMESRYGDTPPKIYSAYVKYLESAGARVVPIRIGKQEDYYAQMIKWTNGVLIPGGAAAIDDSLTTKASLMVFKQVLETNIRGEYYPLWGTCWGFQVLGRAVGGKNVLRRTDSNNVSLPLLLAPDYKSSRMLGSAPHDIIDIISTEPVTLNWHSFSILTEEFKKTNLSKFFNIISTNIDKNGVEFISTIEATGFPIYGVQWHPEKPNLYWHPQVATNHGPNAVKVSQYLANFFVNEARKNFHQFPSLMEESEHMIEHFPRVFYNDGTFADIYYID